MGYPTKVQLIERKKSRQFYIGFPSALAKAIELKKGELVEWIVKDKNTLILKRVKDETTECTEVKQVKKMRS